MTEFWIGGGIAIVISLYIGYRYGKWRMKQTFLELQDAGELFVFTREQYEGRRNMAELLASNDPYGTVSYPRRDARERREDWAIRMKHGVAPGEEYPPDEDEY